VQRGSARSAAALDFPNGRFESACADWPTTAVVVDDRCRLRFFQLAASRAPEKAIDVPRGMRGKMTRKSARYAIFIEIRNGSALTQPLGGGAWRARARSSKH
jgi:hypothetical protein